MTSEAQTSGTGEIRPVAPDDVAAVKTIAVDSGLFGPEEVEGFDEMLAGYFDGSLEGHTWIVLTIDGHIVAGGYYAPEPFSDRMWNLYFLAVSPAAQGTGAGTTIVRHVETALRGLGEERARTLIIETSGVPEFEPTRDFYRNLGYDEEARIRDFYGPGDDKVVFWKRLQTA